MVLYKNYSRLHIILALLKKKTTSITVVLWERRQDVHQASLLKMMSYQLVDMGTHNGGTGGDDDGLQGQWDSPSYVTLSLCLVIGSMEIYAGGLRLWWIGPNFSKLSHGYLLL
jgi:hypothetical protein